MVQLFDALRHSWHKWSTAGFETIDNTQPFERDYDSQNEFLLNASKALRSLPLSDHAGGLPVFSARTSSQLYFDR